MTVVAICGMGRMGSAMARALAASGGDVELLLHNRTPERAHQVAADLGAGVVATPAEAAARADVAITMLADQAAVASVWEGDDGLLAGARAGSVLVDMSTVPPDTLPAYADRARAAGADLLDAPVSGSVALAESGKLTIMIGGTASAFEQTRPIFDRLAQRVFHMGDLGSGHAIKLAVNGVIFALNNALSEALVMAERAGIAREDAYEVLAASAAGAPFVGYKREAFLHPDTAPVGFSLDLAAKDLQLITAFADALGVPVPLAAASRQVIGQAAGAVGGDLDFSAVAVHLREHSSARKGSNQ
jgi:3-hydroxyisobutyrate dehydrogenase/2-hydroxy-3-oxopropionate reductase